MRQVKEELFTSALEHKLGNSWERALSIYRNYGAFWSGYVASALLHAAEQEKVDEILTILEGHFDEHLAYQHPDIRGKICNRGINPTEQVFTRLFENTLGVQPTTE